MDNLALMERVIDTTASVIDRVQPDELTNQTPCTEWTVRDVINHLNAGGTMFAVCVEQGSIPDDLFGSLMSSDNVGDDYKGSFRAVGARVKQAFTAPGALDKMVKLPFGEMPAGVALNIAVFDVLTHAADIAKATGHEIDDTELVETCLAAGRQLVTADLRQPGVFDAEVEPPAGASATDRLLAFAGRKV